MQSLREYTEIDVFSQVYSLQLVVDMRTGEVRSLRQQLAVANQQVDNYNDDKEGDLNVDNIKQKSGSEKVKVTLQVCYNLSSE